VQIQARSDGEMKRKTLKKRAITDKLPEWQNNARLMSWLKELGDKEKYNGK
jgi:hypothetical protein